jgi:hypothetical protein
METLIKENSSGLYFIRKTKKGKFQPVYQSSPNKEKLGIDKAFKTKKEAIRVIESLFNN